MEEKNNIEKTTEETNNTKKTKEVKIYPGIYIVGEDIDEGAYDIEQIDNDLSAEVYIYKNGNEKEDFYRYFHKTCRVRLESGDKLVLHGDDFVIRKAKKISFE